ncbi:MAG: hypothetical protein AAF404_12505 [Pseudomonadota bacterium]
MSSENTRKVSVWFWIVAVLGLLWYLMDFSAFYMRVIAFEQSMASMPQAQQTLYSAMPSWVNGVFALEVFGGLLGCITLLLKRRWALVLLVISLLGVLCQTFYVYFLSDAIAVMGTPAIVMPLVAIAIACILIVVARKAATSGWLG